MVWTRLWDNLLVTKPPTQILGAFRSYGFEQWRGVATKYEERANYRAIVVIAALVIWLTP
jgi:hypothetical protein